jgi:hypothetical protein
VPTGLMLIVLGQRTSPVARLEIGAEDLGACRAQLFADDGLGSLRLVAALLLVGWRIGHW